MPVIVERIKSPAGACKLAITVFGILILGVGLHSHYESTWEKQGLYRYCDKPGVSSCPSISLERYFVAMVILTFLFSCLALVSTVVFDMNKNGVFKMIDIGYHGGAAGLLVIAGLVYIISTEQIENLFKDPRVNTALVLRRPEKLAAGVLTMGQGLLYGFTAYLICKA